MQQRLEDTTAAARCEPARTRPWGAGRFSFTTVLTVLLLVAITRLMPLDSSLWLLGNRRLSRARQAAEND